MLKFLCKKIAFQWIIGFILFALTFYTVITRTQISAEAGMPFLFTSFAYFFSQYEYIGKGIILVVLLFQILFLQYYFKRKELATKNSLFPACFFLSILLLTNSLDVIEPFFFTLFFFIITISIDFTGSSEKIKNSVFWAGIFIALATCFDLCGFVLLFLVIATLIINQFTKIKEIGILLFGFMLLYFFIFSFYFFMDNLHEWIFTYKQIKIMGILNSKAVYNPTTLFSLITLSVVYFSFIIRFKLLSDNKVVIQRNKVVTLNTRAILMLACILLSSSTYPHVLGYLFVHLSIYLSMTAYEKSPLFINEWITLLTLVTLWF